MKQIFLNTPESFLSIVKISGVLHMFLVYHVLFKSGILSELAENWPITQWYTCVLAIPRQENLQIFWNLEEVQYSYRGNLICIYCGEKICL